MISAATSSGRARDNNLAVQVSQDHNVQDNSHAGGWRGLQAQSLHHHHDAAEQGADVSEATRRKA